MTACIIDNADRALAFDADLFGFVQKIVPDTGCIRYGSQLSGLEPQRVIDFAYRVGGYIEKLSRGRWGVDYVSGHNEVTARIFGTAITTTIEVAEKVADIVTDFVPVVGSVKDIYNGIRDGNILMAGFGVIGLVADVATLGTSSLIKGGIKTAIKESAEIVLKRGVKDIDKIKYIGRLEDLKNVPTNQTLLDDLPNKWSHLNSQDAAKYLWRQNSSVLRKAIREGYVIKDASWFRPNSELAPTLLNPTRTIGQTFLGAERTLLNNRGLWP